MKYQVYQDGKPCSSYGYKTWENDIFETLEEAEKFADVWSHPYPLKHKFTTRSGKMFRAYGDSYMEIKKL